MLLEQIQIKTIHKSPKSETPHQAQTQKLKKIIIKNSHTKRNHSIKKINKEIKKPYSAPINQSKNSDIIVFFPFVFSATKQSLSIKKIQREKLTRH